ncbi:unnamed protein product [Blepharisma stoltei]|uniref:Conserved oligomeric Golgi complex subunit 7 n=1 Tax=Blepharisma stoltei TaxID=1481888 RepID=A0AAU9IDK6_9CILI|nr:unnamed protein product [Blepharisma stoltei]
MDDIFQDNWDPVSWLNAILENDSQPEQKLSSLSIKLQLLEQDLEATLEFKSSSLFKDIGSYKDQVSALSIDTIDLIKETERIENAFKSLKTPELEELKRDHLLTERISDCKNALQEIETFESKVERMHALLDSNEDIENVTEQFASMRKSLKFMTGLPQFEKFVEKIESFMRVIKEKLRKKTEEMSKKEAREELKKLHRIYNELENSMEFAEILVGNRLKIYQKSTSDTFDEMISEVLQRIRNEGSLFQTIFPDPSPYLETLFEQILSKERISDLFLGQPIDSLIPTFTSLLSLISYVKNATNSINPISLHIIAISTKLTQLEKKLFDNSNIPRVFRDNPIDNWKKSSQYLLNEIKNSWERCLKITLGTSASEWCPIIEQAMISEIEKFKNEISSFVLQNNIKTLPNLDFTSGPSTQFQLNWNDVQATIKFYEEVLDFYVEVERIDGKIRQEFLNCMTTSYFTTEFTEQKELQDAIQINNPNLAKKCQHFVRTLREGGRFFNGILKILESMLDESKDLALRVLYLPIAGKLYSYHALPTWVEPVAQFSASPSPSIIAVGEHLLGLLQQLAPSSPDMNYEKAYIVEFSVSSPKDLPHGLNVHFWIAVLGYSLLGIFTSKILQIKQLSQQGGKQLAADIEYLLNIIKALTIDKDTDSSHSRNLVYLKNSLQGMKNDNPLSLAILNRMIR